MSEAAGEAGKAADAGAKAAAEKAAYDAERARVEERPRSYWGLRPRRGIRRVLLVVIAAALALALAGELVWLWRHGA